ncbi:MAG: phytanoyl-CoA dioxygenase [Anaerolineaceae bacterium]|nr:phytanoyl-CoA dioxygenase [Anaerolineaceae bacterium]
MSDMSLLTSEQVKSFNEDGVLVVKDFYDLKSEIEPIQRAIHGIIRIIIQKYGLSITQAPFSPETFDNGYQEIIAINRSIGGEIYDAVKQIPAFIRLVSNERHDLLTCQLRDTDLPGIAAGGYGIRIDNPNEEKFRAVWHQEYPSQLRSLDGLVFWSSLVPVTQDIGPVIFCLGSHKKGLVRVHTKDPRNPEKTAAYALVLENEEALVASYPQVAPLTNPGDLVIIDFLTLHASGVNVGKRSRWTMQTRYFTFTEPTGVKIGWKGSFAAGVKFADIHPELVVD